MKLPPAERLGPSQAVAMSLADDVRTALIDLIEHYRSPAAAAYLVSEQGGYVRWVAVGDGMPERWETDAGPAIPVEGGLIGFPDGIELERDRVASLDLVSALLRTHQLERELQHRRFQAGLDNVRLQALYDVGLAIASTLDRDQLIEEVLMRAVALLDARRGALFLYRGDDLRLAGAVGGDAVSRLELAPDELDDLSDTIDVGTILPGAEYVLAHPIEADVRRLGVLVVGDKESRRGVGPFSEHDAPTLGLFANQVAIALENARLHREALAKERLEREMELATEIQQRLLPRSLPELAGFSFAAWSRSARHVGGDYHDLIPLPDGRVALVVADVSGKGVPAALLVSTLHSALRLLLERGDVDGALLASLNDHVAASSTANKFVTFFIAEVQQDESTVRFGNAGHNPALLASADGAIRELGSGGMALGMLFGSSYRTEEVAMSPGDVLCVYSDGLNEAENVSGEEFGMTRLKRALLGARDLAPAQIVERIRGAVETFSSGVAQGDDQTLLLARYLG